jgi:hypothetical protein
MTSLTFMLVCVPLPVCHTTSGKCASSLPSMQGLTLVHVGVQLEQLQDTFMR